MPIRARLRTPPIAIALAIGCAVIATLVAMPLRSTGALTAASLYTLAVVAAAALGGWLAGMAAAAASFLCLNFFFIAPFNTFAVAAREDVAALVVFLVVSATVSSLVASVDRERALALRREQETRLVSALSSDVLSGGPLDPIILRFATSVRERLGLAWVRVSVPDAEPPVEVIADDGEAAGTGEPTFTVPIGEGGGRFEVGSEAPLGRREEQAVTTFARQITLAVQRAELARRVREAKGEVERNEVRAALFSSVTHDLRTPLASIKASLTSLLGDEATFEPGQEKELLTTALEETDRLDRLVGNLLDLARVRAGALTPSLQAIALEDVVAAVMHRLRSRLDGMRVRAMMRPDLPEMRLDPVQMDQAITNVLENAVRASPAAGEITISAARWHGAVQLKISDHGPGIAPEERERVFEAFYRGDRAGGSGLGLAIAHAIVIVHGGKIWIEGTPGGGTTVVMELPIPGESA